VKYYVDLICILYNIQKCEVDFQLELWYILIGYLRTIVPMLNTYESGGVVVTGCLGVTVSLEYRVSLHNLVLKGTL